MLPKIVLYIWQVPQHLLALVLWGFLKIFKKVLLVEHSPFFPENIFITVDVKGWGVSLGKYIFMDCGYNKNIDRSHEIGHTYQSIFFGPLYLLVIGIPSAIFNNLRDRLFHKKWSFQQRYKWYYSRYPEAWADRLGEVQRNFNLYT
ncbi:MAG: hypothetical protein Pg6C_10940 [Treponemataceae bacterium]|nr:MAG: hypothetical protein Pg6C_10940 [Treponemataceae bacterium]